MTLPRVFIRATRHDAPQIVVGAGWLAYLQSHLKPLERLSERLRGHKRGVCSVAVSPDAARHVSRSDDGLLRLRGNLPYGDALQLDRRCLSVHDGRPVTTAEGLADAIGVDGLTLALVCDSDDPPMPPELRR